MSLTHLDVKDEAEMEKKVKPASVAMALAIMVLPLPGGPNNNRPRGGARNWHYQIRKERVWHFDTLTLTPWNKSGRLAGWIIISSSVFLTFSKPAEQNKTL